MGIDDTYEPALIVQHTGQVFPLGKTDLRLGSQEDNTIVLADPRVAPHHAIIFWQADASAYVIDDLGSAQGIYVNGIRVQAPRVLRHGDSIRLGNTVMDLRLQPAPPANTAGTPPPADRKSSGAWFRSPFSIGILIAILASGTIACLALFIVLLLTGGKGTPTVVIQSPATGAQIGAGSELILQATASGAKDITLLELRVDGTLVTMASEPAGTSSLTATKAWLFTTPGEHLISANAYTASDKTGRPASVKVTVTASGLGLTPTLTPDRPTETPTPTVTPSPTPEDTPTPTSVPPPQMEYFQASPASINAGDCTTLQWGRVSNATEADIEPDLGGVGTPGAEVMCPIETTTYILTATGPGGTTQASTTVTVIGGLPDLTIDSIAFVPDPSLAEQENRVLIAIRNAGIGAAGAFSWDWQAGADAYFDGRIYGLGAGETSVVTLFWSPAQPHDSLATQARVDVNNEVRETNEDDNQYAATIEVIEAEVEPVIITLTSAGALDGYRLNDGTGSSSQDIIVGNGELMDPAGELVARGFMSFDLSEIPAGARIESAELRFYQKEVQGSPYEKLGSLVLERVYYGTRLDDSAYDTPVLDSAVLDTETLPQAWYILSDSTIAIWVQASIDTELSAQQFRLLFWLETDGDGQEDWIAIESGGGILSSRLAPQLTITYTP